MCTFMEAFWCLLSAFWGFIAQYDTKDLRPNPSAASLSCMPCKPINICCIVAKFLAMRLHTKLACSFTHCTIKMHFSIYVFYYLGQWPVRNIAGRHIAWKSGIIKCYGYRHLSPASFRRSHTWVVICIKTAQRLNCFWNGFCPGFVSCGHAWARRSQSYFCGGHARQCPYFYIAWSQISNTFLVVYTVG